MNSPEKPFKDVYTSLEVYKASQIIYQEELAFREQNLTSYLPSSNKLSNYILKEVVLLSTLTNYLPFKERIHISEFLTKSGG